MYSAIKAYFIECTKGIAVIGADHYEDLLHIL